MSKIKLTFFGNFVMILTLVITTIFTLILGIICKELLGDKVCIFDGLENLEGYIKNY